MVTDKKIEPGGFRNMFKRTVVVLLTALLISSLSVPCSAADNAFRDAFENALYGGLLGGIVGGALMVFTKKPGDHLDYVYYGAAGGVLVGAGYGVMKSSKSLVSIENGNVQVAMPTIRPELQQAGSKGPSALMVKADLLSGSF